MGTIPHGNSVLAMGCVLDDPEIDVKDDGALPERLNNLNPDKNDYLVPYKHFIDSPFFGCLEQAKARAAGFPGFSPDHPHKILKAARENLKISKTTVLYFDTKFQSTNNLPGDKPGSDIPISNIPFVKREANVTEMHATFWIMELEKTDQCAPPEFVMQYSQTVYLEFFESDEIDDSGKPRLIRWPHVSINTLRKVDP